MSVYNGYYSYDDDDEREGWTHAYTHILFELKLFDQHSSFDFDIMIIFRNLKFSIINKQMTRFHKTIDWMIHGWCVWIRA